MTNLLESIIQEVLEQVPSYYLVELKLSSDNSKISVFVDGDNGVDIDLCTELGREIEERLQQQDEFKHKSYDLEVSSPGLDRPLKLTRQYKKNVNKKLKVALTDGSQITGSLIYVNDDQIMVKKNQNSLESINFNKIENSKVEVF